MHPFVNWTKHTTLSTAGGLHSHEGEEYIYVLEGTLMFHSGAFLPLEVCPGDSFYFDASMPQAYVAKFDSGVRFLSVCSAPGKV